jgi:hypothetical protein
MPGGFIYGQQIYTRLWSAGGQVTEAMSVLVVPVLGIGQVVLYGLLAPYAPCHPPTLHLGSLKTGSPSLFQPSYSEGSDLCQGIFAALFG